MKIAGLQKLTLLDYPGKTAATVFTLGCNFRCPFCHNTDLVTPASDKPSPMLLPEEEFFAFLKKRQGLLDGICITGGEPTLQHDLANFCKRIKDPGFLVKLDTNGSHPAILQYLLENALIDYVAMDVKNSPVHYAETVGFGATNDASSKCNFEIQPIENSMSLLLQGTIPFEFRTTVLNELHTKDFLLETAHWIAGLANKNTYPLSNVAWFIQQFVDSETVFAGEGVFTPWNEDELRSLLPTLQAILPKTALRGV